MVELGPADIRCGDAMTGTATATGMGNRRPGGALGPRFAGPTREEALAMRGAHAMGDVPEDDGPSS